MTSRTTTRLRLRARDYWMIHEARIRDTVSILCVVGILLIVRGALQPAPAPPLVPVVMREAQRPVILIQTSTPLPSPTPAPTATAIVVVQYLEAPTPEPIYVEVPVYIASEPVQEAPAPAEVPTLAPQQMVILDRQAWAQQAQQQGR